MIAEAKSSDLEVSRVPEVPNKKGKSRFFLIFLYIVCIFLYEPIFIVVLRACSLFVIYLSNLSHAGVWQRRRAHTLAKGDVWACVACLTGHRDQLVPACRSCGAPNPFLALARAFKAGMPAAAPTADTKALLGPMLC